MMQMNKKDYEDQKLLVKEWAIWLSMLPESLQTEFLRIFVSGLPDDHRVHILNKFANMVYPELRWIKTERWMEKRFIRDMNRTPRQVASMYLMYSKINTKMAPKMIVLAQKVKDRLRKRVQPGIHDQSHAKKA